MVGGHVERPEVLLDHEPGGVHRDQERGDPVRVAGLTRRPGEDDVVAGRVDTGVPGLLAVDDPFVAVAVTMGLHVGGVRTMLGFGDAEGEAPTAGRQIVEPLALLFVTAVDRHQERSDVVADDGVLVLQVVVETEPLRRKVLPDDRHRQVRSAVTAELGWERVPVVTGLVGETPHLGEQRLPVIVREPTPIPVGAGVLATVVEDADVVVDLLEGTNRRLDEPVELGQIVRDIGRDVEVHDPDRRFVRVRRCCCVSGSSHTDRLAPTSRPPGTVVPMRPCDSPVLEIELIPSDSGGVDPAGFTDAPPPDPWKAIATVAVVLVAGVLLIRATSSPIERPEQTTPEPVARESAASNTTIAPPGPTGVTFERPSYLARVPGPDVPIFADVNGVSLLYVSILGHPTLVDLDTGNRSELHVADDADRYLFMIERGQVVTGDPTRNRSRTPAGDRAFTVLAYRSALQWSDIVDPYGEPAMNVEPMCGVLGCSLPAMGSPASQDGDIIRLLDPEADAEIASLFDPTVWTREDRWMLAPANSGLDLRLPIPAEHSAIYLIYQP